jgi:putative tryptophan/tyrosine transport system substrate-binding protein
MRRFTQDTFSMTDIRFWISGATGKSGLCFTLTLLLFATCVPAWAQQPIKIPRIGYLSASSLAAMANRTEAFRQGLRDFGYVDGKNIIIEYRYGDGN